LKRPFGVGKKLHNNNMSPMEQLQRQFEQDPTAVWLQANPAHVPVLSFRVGQLLTVIGEVVAPAIAILGVNASLVNDKDRSDAGPAEETTTMAEVATATATAPPSSSTMMWTIRARILRNATGTNMKLYSDALLARRKMLPQVQHGPLAGASAAVADP
jgi:hypothetical protein